MPRESTVSFGRLLVESALVAVVTALVVVLVASLLDSPLSPGVIGAIVGGVTAGVMVNRHRRLRSRRQPERTD